MHIKIKKRDNYCMNNQPFNKIQDFVIFKVKNAKKKVWVAIQV